MQGKFVPAERPLSHMSVAQKEVQGQCMKSDNAPWCSTYSGQSLEPKTLLPYRTNGFRQTSKKDSRFCHCRSQVKKYGGWGRKQLKAVPLREHEYLSVTTDGSITVYCHWNLGQNLRTKSSRSWELFIPSFPSHQVFVCLFVGLFLCCLDIVNLAQIKTHLKRETLIEGLFISDCQ